jgi:hypothetical protein
LYDSRLLEVALPGPTVIDYSSDRNTSYFQAQHESTGSGPKYLVSQSQFHNTSVHQHVDDLEVDLHVDISSLVSTLTSGQRSKLASVLNRTVLVIKKQQRSGIVSPCWRTTVPRSPAEMRRFYVKGKYAVLPNLPRPDVCMLRDHATVSLIDCVAVY